MKLLYSNVPPLRLPENAYTLSAFIKDNLSKADAFYCAVGYASKKSLLEIDRLVRDARLSKVVLVLGMYCIEGFPESIYNTAMEIHSRWQEDGIGEIRAVKSMKYHGKIYGFYKSGSLYSAVIGSHNLGALVTDANNLRQYELSICVDSPEECINAASHLESVINPPVSFPINSLDNVLIIHEENTKLNGVEGVTKVSKADVEAYRTAETDIFFDIPLKVPGIPGKKKDYMKSNINKCYAKGRENKRTGIVTERGWWETEIIVGTDITGLADYPEKNTPFYVITDDGWKFLMHVSGDHKKNFESEGDLKILGYWLKGRLVAAGVVEPVDSPSEDLRSVNTSLNDIYKNCKGVITYSKLEKYGRTSVSLTKTLNTLADESGIIRDVWFLSFLPKDVQ